MCPRKMDIRPFFNSHVIYKFNGVHINESNRYVLHFIRDQIISISETAKRESVASPDTDWFSDPSGPPQYSKTAHFRVGFYCGQPKTHLCNNHAV